MKTFCLHKISANSSKFNKLKIRELQLTANSPNLSDLTIWRVTVNE